MGQLSAPLSSMHNYIIVSNNMHPINSDAALSVLDSRYVFTNFILRKYLARLLKIFFLVISTSQ